MGDLYRGGARWVLPVPQRTHQDSGMPSVDLGKERFIDAGAGECSQLGE